MSVKSFRWLGIIACSTLYGLLFLFIRYFIAGGGVNHVQFGLLLLMIPGILAALVSKDTPFTVLSLSILLASLPCLGLIQLAVFRHVGFGQEIALVASAIFWCGSGTLITMLLRTLLAMYQQQSGKRG